MKKVNINMCPILDGYGVMGTLKPNDIYRVFHDFRA